jgi:hypothetical protein
MQQRRLSTAKFHISCRNQVIPGFAVDDRSASGYLNSKSQTLDKVERNRSLLSVPLPLRLDLFARPHRRYHNSTYILARSTVRQPLAGFPPPISLCTILELCRALFRGTDMVLSQIARRMREC